jgi:fructan beta-fructosidase
MKNPAFILVLFASIMPACRQTSEPGSKSNVKPENYYTEQHRPQFHFSPEKMWMNDPNGMVYFEGEYHLFYQYYPDSTVWGPMHWGHAVSEDLVRWQHLPIALYPDSLGYIFSGSAVVDWNNTSGFGKDGKPPLVAIFTQHLMEGEKAGRNDFQYQSIARSNDRGRTWAMYEGNPVIPNPQSIRDFRDPKVIWDEDSRQWVMVFAAFDHVKIYGSPDLKKWTHLSDFGKEWGEHEGIWECPDLFPTHVVGSKEKKWVLLQSLNPGSPNGGSGTQYFIGNFDGKNFTLDPGFAKYVQNDRGVWIDWGRDNYAGVTWADAPERDGNRIFLGWMSNWDYAQVVPTVAWRSAMTLPRTLVLTNTANGLRLYSQPVLELQALRGVTFPLDADSLSGDLDLTDKLGFPPAPMEIMLEVSIPQGMTPDLGIALSNSKGETYLVGFDGSKNEFYSDRTKAGKTTFAEKFAQKRHAAPRTYPSHLLRMHLFFDVASCELFADWGETVMTDLFFPNENFNKITLYCRGGKVGLNGANFYQLGSIWRF